MADEVRVTVIATGFEGFETLARRPIQVRDRARRRGVSGLEDRERRELQVSEGDIDVPDFVPATANLARTVSLACAGVATAALKRTPLYERPRRGGREAGPVRRLGDAGLLRGRARRAPRRARPRCGVFDVSHMGEIETSGPAAEALLQRLLSNDVSKLEVGGAQYSVLCRQDGGILDDLFTYRLADDRYLTVTNAANHERDLAWFAEHAGELRRRGRSTRSTTTRCSPCRGPRRAAIVAEPRRGRAAAAHAHRALELAGAETLVCGTGYTGEDGVELLLAAGRGAARLGRAARRRRQAGRPGRARHAAAGGVLPPVRQRHGRAPQPDRGGPRLVLQGGDGLHRLRGGRRGPRAAARSRSWRRSCSPAAGIPRAGERGRRRRPARWAW